MEKGGVEWRVGEVGGGMGRKRGRGEKEERGRKGEEDCLKCLDLLNQR